ncbi:MAG: glycosyltransferase, partial [Flavobacteriales bacterium]
MTSLSIVIPVYRGAASIERVVRELSALRIEGGAELVLVNDCSPDDSWSIIQRLCEEAPMPIVAI